MKFLALFISVLLPCFIYAQTGTNTTDTTKPSVVDTLDKRKPDIFGEPNEDRIPEGKRRFGNEIISKVDYPRNWEIVENFMKTVFLIKESNFDKEDKFAENVNLKREFAESSKADNADFSINSFVEKTLVDHRNYFEDFELIEHTNGFYRNKNAVILVFTGKANDLEFKIKQSFFVIDDYVYTFTFTAELDKFDTYISVANDIYKSLKVN